MTSILRNLYNGKITPWEQRCSHNEEHLELLQKIEDEEEYFSSIMSPKDRDRFEELSYLHSKCAISEEGEIFSYGFAMGVLFIMDVMEEGKAMKFE